MSRVDPLHDRQDRMVITLDFTQDTPSPSATSASSPGFEILTEVLQPTLAAIKATPSLEDFGLDKVPSPSMLPNDATTSLSRRLSPTAPASKSTLRDRFGLTDSEGASDEGFSSDDEFLSRLSNNATTSLSGRLPPAAPGSESTLRDRSGLTDSEGASDEGFSSDDEFLSRLSNNATTSLSGRLPPAAPGSESTLRDRFGLTDSEGASDEGFPDIPGRFGNNPEAASVMTPTQSYDTTSASDDLQHFIQHTLIDRSPSPLTSEQEFNDIYDIEHGLSSAPYKDDDEHSDATELLDRARQIAASDFYEHSPSRRSARIVSSGSSVQKALARRDELDEKLLGRSNSSSTPSSSQSSLARQDTPPRRGPGRPRKYPYVQPLDPAMTSQSQSTMQAAPFKRGPGRPRKYPPVPSSTPAPAPGSPVKRGPGRPRKSAPGLMQVGTPAPSSQLARAASVSTMTLRRSPARTRMSTPMFASPSVAAKMSAPISPPFKKPVGRPRKSPEVTSSSKSNAAGPDQPLRRPPGRPRKSAPAFIRYAEAAAASQPTPNTSISGIPVKRGPGRPRKHPLVPSPTPALAPILPVKRGPGRPRKSAPSTFAASTPMSPVRVFRTRTSTPSGRRSARLSAPSLTPKPEPPVVTPQSTPLASGSSLSPPMKRGPGRPRKIVPGDAVFASPQGASPSLSAASQPSMFARQGGFQSLKRSASSAFPAESEPPKRRGRPPGPERLRRLMEEEHAKSRSGSEKLYYGSSDIPDDSMSELTELSDDADDSASATRSNAIDIATKKAKRISRQDKDRKRYYVTGLYAGESDATSSTLVRDSTIFPPPMHFGNKLLTEERDYELPFYLHQESEQLRARADARRKPPPYHQIKSNKYTSRPKLQGEITVCYCKPPSNCGADCMNRMTLFICDPKACPCGEACTNISLGKRDAVKTSVAHYGGRGFGLKTMEPIAVGQFIDEYRGEVINLTEMTKRVNEEYMATGNFYLLEYDAAAGELLDGGRKGNITRFANHSCDPNCRIEKFTICGTDESLSAEFQIGLFALRDIQAGEELTYNYGWAAFQPRDINGVPTSEVPPMHCLCGAANCVGILGGKKVPPPKPGDKAINGKKTRRKRRPKALTPKAAASLLAKVTQKQNEAGNSGLSRKVGVRETHRKKAETAVKLAVKMKLKRAARSQPSISSAASETPPVETRFPLSDGDEESTEEQPRPVVRRRGRPPKNAVVFSEESKTNSDASTSRQTRKKGFDNLEHVQEGLNMSGARASVSAVSRRRAAVNLSPRGKSPQKMNQGVKGLSYSAAAAVISDEDDWRDSSDSDDQTAITSSSKRATSSKGKEKAPPVIPKRHGKKQAKAKPPQESEAEQAERRARNAFLARVRRASKRGIIIEDPSQHPLKKVSIQCTAAPENTYIPDLPSSLINLGMSTGDARRSRNAFLARVRRHMKRGFSKAMAIEMAAKPLPGDPAYDTPVMRAQRVQMDQLQRDAADEINADPSQLGSSLVDDDDARSPSWEDMSA